MKVTTKTLSFGLILALALALAQFGSLPLSAQQTDRAKRLGGKLICMCNCNQILTACNHVGCTVSSTMLKELDQRVSRNDSDDLTLQSFVQEYGEKVLAEPSSKGFNSLAWYIPGIAFVLGLGLVTLVISSWRRRIAVAPAGPQVSPEMLARARQQADRETEE
jgi:cytochrome c-type biogenesis protein CcmH/NrfF